MILLNFLEYVLNFNDKYVGALKMEKESDKHLLIGKQLILKIMFQFHWSKK